MENISLIKQRFADNEDLRKKMLNSDQLIEDIDSVATIIAETLSVGGKVLVCGNGGSASDALHFAGELVGRFQKERNAMPAIALNADVATITAIANDYGYDVVFERAVQAYMKPEDILIGISTSGNSENVFRAIQKAKEIGGKTVGLLGKNGGKISEMVDFSIIVPHDITARIQEGHIMIIHIICEIVEKMCCISEE